MAWTLFRSSRDASTREERSAPVAQVWTDTFSTPTHAGVDVSPDAALRLSAVWGCVRLISESVSTLPVDVFRRQADGTQVPAPTPPVLLNPAAGWPITDWLGQVVVSLLLRGNAYGIVTDRAGASLLPSQVELVHPDLVTVTRLDTGAIEYRVGGKVIERADIWHLRGLTIPGALTGLSPIEYARQAIGLGLATEKFGAQFFGGNATPSALLISKSRLSQEQASALKARWNASHKGYRELAVMSGDVELKPVGISPNESQFIETQRFTVSQVARFYGIPPELIGGEAGGSLTYANVEQRNLDYLTHGLAPWITRIEAGLSALLPRGRHVKLNTGALLRTDTLTRYQAHQIGLSAGFLTVNEVRELENLPALPDGDARPPATDTEPGAAA